jgi:hypothetical protein
MQIQLSMKVVWNVQSLNPVLILPTGGIQFQDCDVISARSCPRSSSASRVPVLWRSSIGTGTVELSVSLIQPNVFTALHERVVNLRTSPPPNRTVFGLSRSIKIQKRGNTTVEVGSEDNRYDECYCTRQQAKMLPSWPIHAGRHGVEAPGRSVLEARAVHISGPWALGPKSGAVLTLPILADPRRALVGWCRWLPLAIAGYCCLVLRGSWGAAIAIWADFLTWNWLDVQTSGGIHRVY